MRIASFILLILITTGCVGQKHENVQPEPLIEVSYITTQPTPVEFRQKLSGRVKASMTAEVRPQVDGIIQELLFSEGGYVREGQVLYRLESSTYKADYDQAAALLKNAQVSLNAAKQKYERYRELRKVDGVSAQDLDDIEAQFQQADTAVAQYKAALNLAAINLERTKIKSPISGYAGISKYTKGALVNAGQSDAMVVIRNIDKVYVDMVQSSSLALQRNQNDQKVTITMDNGSEFPEYGTLQLHEISVNESTGTVILRAEFPNPAGVLMPGMYVQASFVNAVNPAGILVPIQSVSWTPVGEAYVMVVNSDNKIEQRLIQLDGTYGNHWSVHNGLNANEKVVVEGLGKIHQGSTVIPVMHTLANPMEQ